MKTNNFISKLPCLIKNHALREIFLIKGIIVNDAWLDSCFDYSSSTDGEEFWTEIRKGNYKPYYDKYGFPDKWKIKILPEWIKTQDWNELERIAELIKSSPQNKSITGVVYLQDHLKNFMGNYLYSDGQIKSPFNVTDDFKEVTMEDYELYKRYSKKKELEDAAEIMSSINKPEVFWDLIGDPENDPKEEFEKMKKDIETLKNKIKDINDIFIDVLFSDDISSDNTKKLRELTRI